MKNPIVFITGASSGIGRACAMRFAKGGYNLILTARSKEKLQPVMDELKGSSTEVLPLIFDVRDRVVVARALENIPSEWKAIDILINNAGLALGLEPMPKGDLGDWDVMIDTNVKALLFITRQIVPGMMQRNQGHIINIGSTAGDEAYANGGVYCATKSAVKFISDGLRVDLKDTPLKVTNIKPGIVETKFSETRFHGNKAKADQVYAGIEALKPEDVADIIYYVAQQPKRVQIAEVAIMATCQGNGYTISRP